MRIDISGTTEIGGFIAACLVDSNTGLMLASEGGGRLDLEAVAALNTNFLRAKLDAIDALGLNDGVEDILITLGKAYHLINLPKGHPGLFIYLVLDKGRANLAMARHKLASLSTQLEV